jgi:hypothetical protein
VARLPDHRGATEERGLVSVYEAAVSYTPVTTALARAGLWLRELVPFWRRGLKRLAG